MGDQGISNFDGEDLGLRTDIRRLGDMLGVALKNLWGEELYELVEYVRASIREIKDSQNHELQDQLVEKLDSSSELAKKVRDFDIPKRRTSGQHSDR